MTSLSFETKKSLVEIGLCCVLQSPLTNIMDVLEFNDEGYLCAGLAGIKDTTMTVARIFAFILKCDEDVEMRENMFVLCRTSGIQTMTEQRWVASLESLGKFESFMSKRYKDCKGKSYGEKVVVLCKSE